jgi:chitin synthase
MYREFQDFNYVALLQEEVESQITDSENSYETIFDSIKIQKADDKLVVCITLYNESEQALLISLYAVSKSIEYLYNKIGVFNKVTVSIVADGIDKLSKTTVNLLYRLKIFNNRKDYSRFGVTVYDSWVSVNSVEQYFQDKFDQGEIDEKWTSLYKSCTKAKSIPQKSNSTNYEFRVLLLVKEKNKGKLDSHWWFFKIFCEKLNPEYCFQLDVGTAPGPESLYLFWKYLGKNKNIGAAASRVQVPGSRKMESIIHAWQYGDFAAQKLLDWPAEIFSGYLTVIPGQFCVFRWKAISVNDKNSLIEKDTNTPLDHYFRGLSDLGPFESNMFLAEDRILGYEIIARKGSGWKLAYVPKVVSITDTCDSLTELFHQRRRWINSSFACNLWLIFKIFNYLKESGASYKQKIHTTLAIPWLIVNCLIQWIFPSLILILIGSLLNNEMGTSNPNFIFSIIKNLSLPIFSLLMIIQISLFYFKRLSAKIEKIIVITASIQVLIIFSGVVYYFINHPFLWGNLNLVSVLLFETVILLFIAAFISKDFLKNLIRNVLQYMIFRPFMLMLLTMYSFSNVHDCSWGTKGLNSSPLESKNKNVNKKLTQFKKFRLSTFLTWIGTNILIAVVFLLQQPNQRESFLGLLLYFFICFTGYKVLAGVIFAMKSIYNKLIINKNEF